MEMNDNRKFIVLMVFAFLNVATAMAATIRGGARDVAGEPLIQASIRLLAPDSALVKAVVTNEKGNFRIENVKAGKYILEASYVGYDAATKNINVAAADLRVEPFVLKEAAIALRDAVVTGIRTPMKVMEDTVEFNANSYKTQPNAVVEDLLKRLPGVEVGSDGKITANGKEVKKILVDGKEFFSDDPTVASRNLPVDMVEKLQVVDRKSDLARMTGVDDGEDETVINLTVKKGMKNGWFGNAEAGYGTDSRYKGAFNVNRFWNENQITFLGSSNNVNEPAFMDGAAARFARFGGNNGITKANSLGVNFNIGNGEVLRLGGNVMYSDTDRDTRTQTEREYIFTDSTSTNLSNKIARDKGRNLRADFRLQWKPDSFNTFEFRPNISFNTNDSWSVDSASTYAGNRLAPEVTRSFNSSTSTGKSFEFGGDLVFNHNFRSRPGRSFSISANYNLSNKRENSDTYSRNRFFMLGDSIDERDQYADNHTWSNSVRSRLTWTEPIGDIKKGNYLVFAYNFSYRWNNADKLVYDRPGDVFNSLLSNQFRNDFMSQDIRFGYRKVSKNANLNVGISFVPQSSQSINLINDAKSIPRRNVLNVAPFLRYRYKMSKTRSIQANYRGRSSQPSMTQLQPVADISDPMRIVIGNPNLKPTFTHYATVRFQDFNSEAQRSMMLMLDAQAAQNSIIPHTTFNRETGAQTTTYDNINGVWNVRLMNMISMPFRNKAFTFNNHIFLNNSADKGYVNDQLNTANSFMVNESFGIAWRPENLEFELRPRYSLQSTTNSISTQTDRLVHSYGGSFYATYNLPFGLVLNSDLNYAATKGYAQGFDTDTWIWNASIGYQFLRGRNATVTLKAYDLLGQTTNVRRSVAASSITDTRYNSLTRYVMLTLSYKFTTFGKGEQPRDRNMEGFGGHGRGPGGPPPGHPRF